MRFCPPSYRSYRWMPRWQDGADRLSDHPRSWSGRWKSRPLQDQIQLDLAKTVIVPADPLMQFGRRILLLAQIVGERERQPVDIGLQKQRQCADTKRVAAGKCLRQFTARHIFVVDRYQIGVRNLVPQR